MINGVNSSECCLTPKVLRNRGINEKGADNIKNATVFFVLHNHFVKKCKDKIGGGEYLRYLKKDKKIYHYILKHYLAKRS